MEPLHVLRMSVARIAQELLLQLPELPVLVASDTELQELAQHCDRGWNKLAAMIADDVRQLRKEVRLADGVMIDHLPEDLRQIAQVVLEVVEPSHNPSTQSFYTPEAWRARGEEYGCDSLLVVRHEGGDLAPYFSYDYEAYQQIEQMRQRLAEIGLYAEQCTGWYSAIYRIDAGEQPGVDLRKDSPRGEY